MMPSNRTYTIAHHILDAVVEYYQTQNVPLPERRYVAPGTPVLDCEQLTVHAERSFANAGDVGLQVVQPLLRHPGHAMRTMVYVVSLWRCVPNPETQGDSLILAPVSEEEAAAAEIQADSIHLFNAMLVAERDGLLGGCDLQAILEWVAVGPEGGLAGGYLRLWVGLT